MSATHLAHVDDDDDVVPYVMESLKIVRYFFKNMSERLFN